MVWLAGVVPYAEAHQVFKRIGQVEIPITSLWERAQTEGRKFQAHQQHHQTQVRVERVVLPPAGQDHTQRKGVSLDGGTMHIRGEGWKEFKAGTACDLGLDTTTDPETGEPVEVARGEHIGYCAVLGSVTDFAPALWALAVDHQLPQAADVVVTADGADWIWNVADDYFPESAQIVDWYHAAQHVAQAATALHPTDEVAAHRWQQEQRQALYLGQIDKITTPLDKAGLTSVSQYFHTHERRMQYQEFREQGYPLGSGTVESGIKRFKQRVTGPGMRWSRAGAERMLLIRAAVMTNNFDARWAETRN
jgi:hypothetical protein